MQGIVRERGEFLGVRQPGALLQQSLVFARLELGGGDLVDLEVEHVQPPLHLAFAQAQRAQLFADGVEVAHHFRQPRPLVFEVSEAVEQVEVLARAQEREVLALAVHVHEQLADLFEDGQADDAPVDAADIAALAPHLAGQADLGSRFAVEQLLAGEDRFHGRTQTLP